MHPANNTAARAAADWVKLLSSWQGARLFSGLDETPDKTKTLQPKNSLILTKLNFCYVLFCSLFILLPIVDRLSLLQAASTISCSRLSYWDNSSLKNTFFKLKLAGHLQHNTNVSFFQTVLLSKTVAGLRWFKILKLHFLFICLSIYSLSPHIYLCIS